MTEQTGRLDEDALKQLKQRMNRKFTKEEQMKALAGLVLKQEIPLLLPPWVAFQIVAQLQLALRHPNNTGPVSEQSKAFIAQLRPYLGEPGGVIDWMIEAGFDPDFDEPAKEDGESEGTP